jgi:hypothetical protein
MKLLHTSDWQIGKPFARVTDEAKRARIRSARSETAHEIGRVANTRGASFVLVAGDLFDSPTADQASVSAVCDAIGKAGLPFFIIPGNHDFAGPGSVWEQDYFKRERDALAPNLRVLLTPAPVETDDAIILPCPLLRRHEPTDQTAWLRASDVYANLPAGKPRIALAHGSVQSFGASTQDDEDEDFSAGDNLLDLTRLPADEIDYTALGDWHGTKQVDAKAWYSGTPEIDRFPKGESNDPGHVLLVEAARGGAPSVEKIMTSRLAWHNLPPFEFSDDASFDVFKHRLSETLGGRIGTDLIKLDLSGALGFAALKALEAELETLTARHLRVKLTNAVRPAPSPAEIEALTHRTADPVISRVADALLAESRGADPTTAETARLALRELFAAVTA